MRVTDTMLVYDCYTQVFGCDFQRDTVRYEHSGNPLLSEDSVLLLIYRFSDARSDVERLSIRLTIASPAYEVILTGADAGMASLGVDSVAGALTQPVDSAILQFRLNSDLTTTCLVTYGETTTVQPFPESGQLVRGRTNDVVHNHTGSCRNFLYQGFRYTLLYLSYLRHGWL